MSNQRTEQFENLSKALASPTSRRQAIKLLAATATGGMLALGSISTSLADEFQTDFTPPPPPPEDSSYNGGVVWDQPNDLITSNGLNFLVIRIEVGSDDFRADSKFITSIMLDMNDGSKQLINYETSGTLTGGWTTGDLITQSIHFPPGPVVLGSEYILPVPVNAIRYIQISFKSTWSGFETPDNWNISKIRAIYPKVVNQHDQFQYPNPSTPGGGPNLQDYHNLFFGASSSWVWRFETNPDPNEPHSGPVWVTYNTNPPPQYLGQQTQLRPSPRVYSLNP